MKVKRFILRGSELTGLLVFALMVGLGTAAYAVPSLGIGTGVYEAPCSMTNYWDCFSGEYASGSEDMGFLIDGSPQTLTLFSNIDGAEIFLMTTEDVWSDSGGTIRFDGALFEEMPNSIVTSVDGTFGAYKDTPYYGLSVGTIEEWSSYPSSPLDNPPFEPDPFYSLQGILTFGGSLPEGSYFFLVADDNGMDGLQGDSSEWGGYGPDSFSPKTTSAKVPEPSTLSMLVAGGILFVFGLAIRRRVSSGR